MPELKLRFQNDHNGDLKLSTAEGVKTNIFVSSGSGKDIRNVTIPVGYSSFSSFSLSAGSYSIECLLPSGEVVTEDVEIGEQDVELVVNGEDSPHEWLTWQKFSGNIPAIRDVYESTMEDTGLESAMEALLDEKGQKARVLKSFRAPQMLNLKSNAYWRDIIHDSATRGSDAEFENQLETFETVVLNRLFDASSVPAFQGRELWGTLAELIKSDATEVYDELLQKSRNEVKAGGTELIKISPESEDENAAVFSLQSEGESKIRTAFLWTPSGIELMRLPASWVNVDSKSTVPIEVMVDLENSERRFRSAVTVRDPTMLSCLAYLSAGNLNTAGAYIRSASSLLYEKMENPYAAAIGAYTLLKIDGPDELDQWPNWIENLNEMFDWLPDAAVLRGWLNIQRGEIHSAVDDFLRAYDRGIPVFAPLMKMMLDGVRLLSSKHASIQEIQLQVEPVAFQMNTSQPFTIVLASPG